MNRDKLIELIKFTAFEMLIPQKISDEDAESILVDFEKQCDKPIDGGTSYNDL